MPLTASKTEDDTDATTRLLTSGLLPPAMTVVFMTPIHSNTGSGVAAATCRGLAASNIASSIRIAHLITAPLRQPSNGKERAKWNVWVLRIMFPPRMRRQRCYGLADALR